MGGGVLLYVKSFLAPIECRRNKSIMNMYGVALETFIRVCYRSFNLAVVGDDNESKLRQVLQEESNKHILLISDFKYPDFDWLCHSVKASASPGLWEFLKVVENCFLTQHVLTPTHDDSILDLVLTNEPDLISDVSVINSLGSSDHNMVAFSAQMCYDHFANKRTTRNYAQGDYDGMNGFLLTAGMNYLEVTLLNAGPHSGTC